SPIIRTVTGDLAPADLGATDYHEHLFQVTPLLAGEELDEEMASSSEAVALHRSGAGAMVEATPIGLGRDPAAVARIAQQTGLHARFRREVLEGVDGAEARAGLVKAGVGLWSIGPFEQRALAAAGRLSAELGLGVMVHLEHATAAHEVLDLLATHGCPADRVALAHVDRNPDPVLHADLASRGAYLGYDGAGRYQYWPESVLIDCLAATIEAGAGERVLLGGDVARRSRSAA